MFRIEACQRGHGLSQLSTIAQARIPLAQHIPVLGGKWGISV